MSNEPYAPDPRAQGYPQPPNQMPIEGRVSDATRQTVRASSGGDAYAQSQQESYVDPMGNQVESRSEVIEDENQSRANSRYWTTRIINFLLGVLEVILFLRFLFRLLAANQYNAFVSLLYNISYTFVLPFRGIFGDPHLSNGSVFEVSTIIAMIVYALIAWGIISLVRVLLAPNYSGRQSITTTRRRRPL